MLNYEDKKEDYRKEFVLDIAKNMDDNDSLTLFYLYTLYKEYQRLERTVMKNLEKTFDAKILISQSFSSVDEISSAVSLSGSKTRTSLIKLKTGNLIERKKEDHKWLYSITKDGVTALNYLCDPHRFPERVKKVDNIKKK